MNELLDLMARVESPGTFALDGPLSPTPPGLTVKGLGAIALPFQEHQAKALIELCQQAPYGLREETIVDTDVRRVWQISAEDFELTNPQWHVSLQAAVDEMGRELGLEGCKIEFDQYKLLVYETGSFFAAHRDTEKIPNMFATLVVNLPSTHEGGELVISHGGQTHTVSYADSDPFLPSYAVFYADCYHEVKPVTSGYRLSIVYNLAIADREEQPRLAEQSNVYDGISRFLQTWASENTNQPILAYLLDHSYSEQNLSMANLKHGDFAKASVLLNVAAENDYQAYLCLVTYHRESYGEATYSSRRGYWGDDELDESDFEEYDIGDEETYAHVFMSTEGVRSSIKQLALSGDELIANTALMDGDYEMSISEATGNEGATKDLWYHRGAVIMWPLAHEFDLLPSMDVSYGVELLNKVLNNQDNERYASITRPQLIQLADSLMARSSASLLDRVDLSEEVIAIGDTGLLTKLLEQKTFRSYDYGKQDVQLFRRIVDQFGWQPFDDLIRPKLNGKMSVLQWVNKLVLAKPLPSSEGETLMIGWVKMLWAAMRQNQLTRDDIAHFMQMIARLDIGALTDEFIATMASQPRTFIEKVRPTYPTTRYRRSSPPQPAEVKHDFLTDIYARAVLDSYQALSDHRYAHGIMRSFANDVVEQLEEEHPMAPVPPETWAREGQLNCDCKFCKQVNEFLPDPERSELRFSKTLKRDMTHVQDNIEASDVDLSLEITRMPPKFGGICTKTSRNYDEALVLFKRAQELIGELAQD